MQNTSPRRVGRRALIKGTAMLAVAATARAQGQPGDAFLRDVAHELEHGFGIGHATVQVETGADEHCADCA